MKIATNTLVGRALDYAVGKSQGWVTYPTDSVERGDTWHMEAEKAPFGRVMAVKDWRPSTNWADGGPLFDKYNIATTCPFGIDADEEPHWAAAGEGESYGPTKLVAAMRAIVLSQLGEEVEVPDELGGH